MAFLYRRSGVLAFGLFALAIVMAVLRQNGASGIPKELYGFLGLLSGAISLAFLIKSYTEAHSVGRAGGVWLLLHAVGAFFAALIAWWFILLLLTGSSPFILGLVRAQGSMVFKYVAEQLLAGALFDLLEAYKIRLTEVDYPAGDLIAATIVFGIRLTGSAIVAALAIRALTQPERKE